MFFGKINNNNPASPASLSNNNNTTAVPIQRVSRSSERMHTLGQNLYAPFQSQQNASRYASRPMATRCRKPKIIQPIVEKEPLKCGILSKAELETYANFVHPTQDAIADFMLGYCETPEKGIDHFLANVDAFKVSLSLDSFLATKIFPTERVNVNHVACPVVTPFTKEVFQSNPVLQITHQRLANLALANFALSFDHNEIQSPDDMLSNPPDWLTSPNDNPRLFLKQIATSLFLLGNVDFAVKLCEKAYDLLTAFDHNAMAADFALLKQQIKANLNKQEVKAESLSTQAQAEDKEAAKPEINFEPKPSRSAPSKTRQLISFFNKEKPTLEQICQAEGLNPQMYMLVEQKGRFGRTQQVLKHKAEVLYAKTLEEIVGFIDSDQARMKATHTEKAHINLALTDMFDATDLASQQWLEENLDNPDYANNNLNRIFVDESEDYFYAEFANGKKVRFSDRSSNVELRGIVLRLALMEKEYASFRELIMSSYMTINDPALVYSAAAIKSMILWRSKEEIILITDAIAGKTFLGIPIKDLWRNNN